MSSIFASMTALSLLAHSVLGCCWHHTHACQDADTHEASEDLCGGHCHADRPASAYTGGQGHCHGAPAGPDDCRGTRCVFVTAERIAASAYAYTLHLSPAAFAAHAEPIGCDRWNGREGPAASAGLLPLRIHLFYQILLI